MTQIGKRILWLHKCDLCGRGFGEPECLDTFELTIRALEDDLWVITKKFTACKSCRETQVLGNVISYVKGER